MNTFETLRLEHTTTVDRVADELRRALFHGEVRPGTPLREVALAGAMGVSRSTVREALGVLVGEGLATRAPNRGVHVAELGPLAVHDVCATRVVLETAGVRRWAEASEDAREACRSSLRDFADAAASPGSGAGLTAAHLAVHDAFVGLTESARMVAVAGSLTSEIRLALVGVDRVRRDATEQVRAHTELLDLLERGDVEAAAAGLVQHLAHTESAMLAALDLGPAPGSGFGSAGKIEP